MIRKRQRKRRKRLSSGSSNNLSISVAPIKKSLHALIRAHLRNQLTRMVKSYVMMLKRQNAVMERLHIMMIKSLKMIRKRQKKRRKRLSNGHSSNPLLNVAPMQKHQHALIRALLRNQLTRMVKSYVMMLKRQNAVMERFHITMIKSLKMIRLLQRKRRKRLNKSISSQPLRSVAPMEMLLHALIRALLRNQLTRMVKSYVMMLKRQNAVMERFHITMIKSLKMIRLLQRKRRKRMNKSISRQSLISDAPIKKHLHALIRANL